MHKSYLDFLDPIGFFIGVVIVVITTVVIICNAIKDFGKGNS